MRMARVTLAYLEGGALVKYVLARWGQATLKRFCVDVADGSLQRPGGQAGGARATSACPGAASTRAGRPT